MGRVLTDQLLDNDADRVAQPGNVNKNFITTLRLAPQQGGGGLPGTALPGGPRAAQPHDEGRVNRLMRE